MKDWRSGHCALNGKHPLGSVWGEECPLLPRSQWPVWRIQEAEKAKVRRERRRGVLSGKKALRRASKA